MRLTLANPNMTRAMTDRMVAIARAIVPPGTEIEGLTAPRGFPYISSLAEAQIAGAICLEMMAEGPAPDAAIIAAFGDPGLAAARNLFGFPIVGMAEAAVLTAAQLGDRFAIVTFTPEMRQWYGAGVAALGLAHRFAGVFTPAAPPGDITGVADRLRDALIDLANRAARDGADVVILGGAPLAGLAAEVADEVPATLVDPISAAALQAVALARLGAHPHRRLSRPAPKHSTGLADPLARLIAQETP